MAKRRSVLITFLGIIGLSGCTSNESSSENSNGGGTSDSESGNSKSSDEESLESQYPDYYVIEESTKLVALSDIEANADSFSVTITGTVVNGSDTDYEYAQVEFGLYNDSGAKVGNAVDNISGLNAGQRWRYEAVGTSESAATWELEGLSAY